MAAPFTRCRACGDPFTSQFEALICCMVDPRAAHTHANGKPRRLPGNWCLWCGEDVPEGQSFCNKPCAISFAEDEALSRTRKTPDQTRRQARICAG